MKQMSTKKLTDIIIPAMIGIWMLMITFLVVMVKYVWTSGIGL